MARRKIAWPKVTRDGVLFIGGLAGITYETVFYKGETRDVLVLAFLAMMGLPAFLRADEARRNGNGKNGDNDATR